MQLFNLADTDASKIVIRHEPTVFFLQNASRKIEFSLEKPGVRVRIFALFYGKRSDSFSLTITQSHRKPDTESHLTALSILEEHAHFSYDGRIRIEKGAVRSDSSQKNINVLLSENARAESKPTLEILEEDVSARHASASGNMDQDALMLALSRGITSEHSRRMLAEGTIRNFFDEMRIYTDNDRVHTLEEDAFRYLWNKAPAPLSSPLL